MPSKMNEACTLKLRQIVKSPALAMGMSPKDVSKYKKIAAVYGNVAPVIVGAPQNNGYPILTGSARLEACAQTGIREIPAVMVQEQDEKEQLKLSLMLSTLQDEGGALSEGELISQLINECGVAPRELVRLLGKSKAWISKRMGLAKNLASAVKIMVTDGTLCPRSAEEVAKLAQHEQAEFAANAVDCGLNKNEISQLVQLYKNALSDDVRREVIKSPLDALSKIGVRQRKKESSDAGLNVPGRKLQSSANYAAQMILKTANMVENAEEEAISGAYPQLNRLRNIMGEVTRTINRLVSDVSPGKQHVSGRSPTPEGRFCEAKLLTGGDVPW
jgi:ParB family chromosome partitioning protein